ncbi:carboxypeptidase [Drepanopeziza brunnea f. sp. 'multigermtubi' MB_m1]|uniref:Carboxypeptidase n=1 Tax=Marssonina brunnea f. sp. multigermtubi (strain MB_m1) TaxID=1072389 RepID=K1X620_MARBU|nr:carboxypeptidase [Drepanopeziza brunnea f. sp. 'multigermtubi' MB_m1]EKD16093.1 carboxypeptidase [Drepanopeziza brunnea f. sp. 'multigermtubi' MB_m1]
MRAIHGLGRTVEAYYNGSNLGETIEVDHPAAHPAEKPGVRLHAFDGVEEPSSIILTHNDDLNPGPVSPSGSSSVTPFRVLPRWNGSCRLREREIITTPGDHDGGHRTDNHFFWDLATHIFRFRPGYDPAADEQGLGPIHTVDERGSVVKHINAVNSWVYAVYSQPG